MNSTTDKRSAADIEREGEQIRANLDQTLDEIQRKFSSGELLDRSVEFIRDTGGEFLREAAETIRRNPVPAAFTAAGLIWLATSVVRSRSRESYSDTDYLREPSAWDTETHGRMRDAARRVRSKAREAGDRMSDRMDRMSDRMSDSMETVQRRTRRARSQLDNLVREQPLALGALALAAGALIGAALPMTRYENKYVGPVHDRTLARAKEVGRREYDNLKEAVASSLERRSNGSQASGHDGGSQRPAQS